MDNIYYLRRNSRPEVFYKKGALRNFTKYYRLKPATLLKKRLIKENYIKRVKRI